MTTQTAKAIQGSNVLVITVADLHRWADDHNLTFCGLTDRNLGELYLKMEASEMQELHIEMES